MTVHASKELHEAMCGEEPIQPETAFEDEDPDASVYLCTGVVAEPLYTPDLVEPYWFHRQSPKGHGDDPRVVDCPDCLRIIRASLPEEALVRLDYLEERGSK